MLLGINAINHDASICLVDGDKIKFAAHAERYSRVKNDKDINTKLLDDCWNYGDPERIIWFEKPFLKATRRFYAGQKPYRYNLKHYLKQYGLDNIPFETINHHKAHAAMGFYTSGFDKANVFVIDAIGEWDTTTLWAASNAGLTNEIRLRYPHSIGLFYTAATQAIGLKPNEEEYILMGMAALGEPKYYKEIKAALFKFWQPPYFGTTHNLHQGLNGIIDVGNMKQEDFAASVQKIFEEYVVESCKYIYCSRNKFTKNLVLVGGSALNCVANTLISKLNVFDNIWVPPNPGDAGLSLGAIAAYTKTPVRFEHAFLGHEIVKDVDITELIHRLYQGEVVGLANGRAEWGPRALGNRSLLADPRGPDVKDRVNAIKHREPFRPFAPIILEEFAKDFFELDNNNHNYMQYAVKCKVPDGYPAIIHCDGTSRVQTVPKNSLSIIRRVLEAWCELSGCPMLLNTSLNIKGEPLVNTAQDASAFKNHHNVKVF